MNIVVVRLCYNEHVTVDATVSLHARAVAYVYSVLELGSCIQVIWASQYIGHVKCQIQVIIALHIF